LPTCIQLRHEIIATALRALEGDDPAALTARSISVATQTPVAVSGRVEIERHEDERQTVDVLHGWDTPILTLVTLMRLL